MKNARRQLSKAWRVFLHHSNQLVVCWTGRYFTRLWCVYEIASWLYLNKSLDSIVFRSVPLERDKLILMLALAATYFIYSVALLVGLNERRLLFYIGFALALVPLERSLRDMTRQMKLLDEQLGTFTIRQSSCFCCSHNHTMPGTDLKIPCDRKLVYSTIRSWHRETTEQNHGSPLDDCLEEFDCRVRTEFASKIKGRAGKCRLTYRDTILWTSPIMWHTCDVAVCMSVAHKIDVIRLVLLEFVALWLLVMPISVKMSQHVLRFLDSITTAPAHPKLDRMLIPLRYSLIVVCFLLWWLPLHLSRNIESVFPVIAYDALLLLIVAMASPQKRRY